MTYPLVPFTASSKDSASALNNAFNVDRYVFAPTDQSVTNSVAFISSTYISLSVAASSSYLFECFMIFDANTTADFAWQWIAPAGTFMREAFWCSSTSAATADATIFHHCADVLTGTTSGGIAAGTYMSLLPMGLIITSTTAGFLTLQFSQAVANNVNPTILKAGTWLHLRKVA